MVRDFIKWVDNLPKIGKLILCIPMLNIVFSVYKLCRSIDKNDTLWIVLGVLAIFPGAMFMWLVDLISLLVYEKVLWGC